MAPMRHPAPLKASPRAGTGLPPSALPRRRHRATTSTVEPFRARPRGITGLSSAWLHPGPATEANRCQLCFRHCRSLARCSGDPAGATGLLLLPLGDIECPGHRRGRSPNRIAKTYGDGESFGFPFRDLGAQIATIATRNAQRSRHNPAFGERVPIPGGRAPTPARPRLSTPDGGKGDVPRQKNPHSDADHRSAASHTCVVTTARKLAWLDKNPARFSTTTCQRSARDSGLASTFGAITTVVVSVGSATRRWHGLVSQSA